MGNITYEVLQSPSQNPKEQSHVSGAKFIIATNDATKTSTNTKDQIMAMIFVLEQISEIRWCSGTTIQSWKSLSFMKVLKWQICW